MGSCLTSSLSITPQVRWWHSEVMTTMPHAVFHIAKFHQKMCIVILQRNTAARALLTAVSLK